LTLKEYKKVDTVSISVQLWRIIMIEGIIRKAVEKHAEGCIELHKANIEVYLANPAGIGEHSDIMEAIQAELDKMAVHIDRLEALETYF
jgi:RIO-like serine/threonine protein kinase